MKNGKLEECDIGKKFRKCSWQLGMFFRPLAITSIGLMVGEDEKGKFYFVEGTEMWLHYEEQKQKCEYCNMPIELRNPSGDCDHLYYPENVNKNFGKKQKHRIEAAPAVKYYRDFKVYFISAENYKNYEEAKKYLGESLIKWPADFDKEKGVWFYEWEE